MAGLVPATHFPEASITYQRLWKMDGRHESGHDELDLILKVPKLR
jgi:hypothetical protein